MSSTHFYFKWLVQTSHLKSFNTPHQTRGGARWVSPAGLGSLNSESSSQGCILQCFSELLKYDFKDEIFLSSPGFGRILLLWQFKPLSNFKPNICTVILSPFVLVPTLSSSLNVDLFPPLDQNRSHSRSLPGFFWCSDRKAK